MEQNKNSDERLEELVATGSVAEQNSPAVLESESIAQNNEDGNWNGEVVHFSCASSQCAVEPEENWDDDDNTQPSTYVIPLLALKSKEIYNGDLVQPSAEGSFPLDGAFANDDKTSSGSSECYFPGVEKSCERNQAQNYSYKYDMKKIFVKNVNFKTSQKVLWKFFDGFGKVKYCRLLLDKKGHSTGNAVVTFSSEGDAKAVVSTSQENLSLYGRALSVCIYRKKIFESKSTTTKPETNLEVEKETEIPDSSTEFDNSTPAPIDRLSDEMIAYILTFLKLKERLLAERISRRFRNVSIGYWSMVKKIKIEASGFCGPMFEDRHLESLVSRGSQSLISLTLSSSSITDSSLLAIAENCENLQELRLIRGQFTNNGLKTLSDGCRQLRSFTIDCSSYEIGEKGLWWIFHRCKMLQDVNVSGNKGLKGQCLHVLGPEITHLNFADCSKLKDVGIEKVQRSCGKIRDLSVASCCLLTDSSLSSIGQCSSIVSLNISNIAVTENGLKELCHLKQLEHLIARNIPTVDDDFLVAISKGCRQLRTLDVSFVNGGFAGGSNVTDVGISIITARCLLLSSLNISNHPKISDLSLEYVSQLESLEKLFLAHCVNVTDEGVVCLITRCQKLRVLDLYGCWRVGNESLEAAITRAESNLGSLELSLTETSVDPAKFPENTQNLEISYEASDDENGNVFGFHESDDDFDDDDDDDDDYKFDGQCFPVATDDDFDGFLETDDPLDAEQWEMS